MRSVSLFGAVKVMSFVSTVAFASIVTTACDPAPSASSGATTSDPAPTKSAEAPGSLAPLSPTAMADQPIPPAPIATAESEPEVIAAQHVLIAYKGATGAPKTITRSKADAKKRAEEVVLKAKKGEDFTALVKQYSDEPGAAERLGNLGKFKREAMVKPFSDAAFKLKLNETSDVVETAFGFHVIKRNQ